MNKQRSKCLQICDVLVIGGGPAGTTIATLLQQRGRQVTLLEKDTHPRFHIGESLLPMNLPILERLGIADQIAAIGVPKYGAEFGSAQFPQKRMAWFDRAFAEIASYAYQVRRSEFDQILFSNCTECGVDTHQGVQVLDVDFNTTGKPIIEAVDAQHIQQKRYWQAEFVIDASGRDTLLARKLSLKQKNRRHRSAAIFAHFNNVERLAGKQQGNISVYWFEHGWFWFIPLPDNAMSVGAVCRPEYLKQRAPRSAEQFLWDTIVLCPDAACRMRQATLSGKAQATGNYSYHSRRMYGERFLLIGDAFVFVDPVFSTGVFLAMHSAELGAKAVDTWLDDPRAAKPLFNDLEREMHRGVKRISWFIYRFTSPAMHYLFMNPRDLFNMEQTIVSMLAGDLFNRRRTVLSLSLFKIIYWLTAMINLRSNWSWFKRSKQ